jgi:hypothetical protein
VCFTYFLNIKEVDTKLQPWRIEFDFSKIKGIAPLRAGSKRDRHQNLARRRPDRETFVLLHWTHSCSYNAFSLKTEQVKSFASAYTKL